MSHDSSLLTGAQMLVEYQQASSIGEDDALLRDYATMEATLLPVDDPYALLKHHTNDSLRRFHRQCRDEFEQNVMLVSLPDCVTTTHVDIAGVLLNKRVYNLDSQQYVFVSADDCERVKTISTAEQLRFQAKYANHIYPIVHHGDDDRDDHGGHVQTGDVSVRTETVTTKTVSLKTTVSSSRRDKRLAKKMRYDDDADDRLLQMLSRWKEEHDSVLSRNYELQQENERYRAEKELSEARHKIELQEMELACYRMLHQNHMAGAIPAVMGTGAPAPINNTLTGGAEGVKGVGHGDSALTTTAVTTTTARRGITRVSEWLGENRYGQAKFLGADRPCVNNYQKWDCMFENPSINAAYLCTMIRLVPVPVDASRVQRHRLLIPLTYMYNLRAVLQLLRDQLPHGNHRQHWDTLIDACPADYRIVLFAPDLKNETQAVCDTRNCVTLATHLHFIQVARLVDRTPSISGGKWKTRCDSLVRPQARFLPDLSILEEWYPASLHFGSNTLLTFELGLRVKYIKNAGGGDVTIQTSPKKATNLNKLAQKAAAPKKASKPKRSRAVVHGDDSDGNDEAPQGSRGGVGTGNGKNCQMCCSLAMMIKKTGHAQISHHPNRCHALATLSNNEVDIMNHIMLACKRVEKSKKTKKRKPNPLPKLKFYFGIPDGKGVDRDLLQLDGTTLLRHATPEELASGQHVNGLRLNRPVYIRMRREMYGDMRDHLDGDLMFGAMDTVVQQAMEALDGLQDLATTDGRMPLVRQLIYESGGIGFLSSKFDEAKRPHRTFADDDGLFFALDPTQALTMAVTPRMVAHHEFYQREMANQQQFIAMCNEQQHPIYMPPLAPLDFMQFGAVPMMTMPMPGVGGDDGDDIDMGNGLPSFITY